MRGATRILRLVAMHRQAVVSDAEFATARAKLLAAGEPAGAATAPAPPARP